MSKKQNRNKVETNIRDYLRIRKINFYENPNPIRADTKRTDEQHLYVDAVIPDAKLPVKILERIIGNTAKQPRKVEKRQAFSAKPFKLLIKVFACSF